MRYVSTRGKAPVLAFDDVLLTGLARDGGLYVPESWPTLDAADLDALKGHAYPELAARLLAPFVAGSVAEDGLAELIAETYATFEAPDVVPLKDMGDGVHLMELFHGPTLAFKDVAMQFLARLFDRVLKARGERIVILGATSGDTGAAAVEAFRDKDMVDVFMLHPENRVSPVQRRQMTTVDAPNIHNVAIQGTFDDCQDLVKAMFNDPAFRARHPLSAVNSINWARVMAQIVYYVWAHLRLGADRTAFAVPTGNFGNVLAGYAAKQMGVAIPQLVVGSNANDILTRFFETGAMQTGEVYATLSPSMDIQVSSNFERLLFDLVGHDGARVAEIMAAFRETGRFEVAGDAMAPLRGLFDAASFDDDATTAVIRQVHEATGELIDPHTAVGYGAALARRRDPSVPMVVAATAHPAKFPDAVEAATGVRPGLPDRLSDLLQRPEKVEVMPPDVRGMQAFVDEKMKLSGRAA